MGRIKIYPLASGSKRNCTIVDDGYDAFLLDAGVSVDEVREHCITNSLKDVFERIRIVVISHEHMDHAMYKEDWTKHLGDDTFVIEQYQALGVGYIWTIDAFEPFKYNNWVFKPFPVTHSVENVGYIIKHIASGYEICWFTDASYIPSTKTKNYDVFLIECNNNFSEDIFEVDIKSFMNSYGSKHHLTLNDTHKFLDLKVGEKLKHIHLLHLSTRKQPTEILTQQAMDMFKLKFRMYPSFTNPNNPKLSKFVIDCLPYDDMREKIKGEYI